MPPAIEFDHVSFSFGAGAVNAVDNVSFSVSVGGTLGIIGGTGSGKSTLVSLIPRLYDASTGTVRVFGRDVRAWNLDQLREVIGMVPQRASLMSGTIRSNLRSRRPRRTILYGTCRTPSMLPSRQAAKILAADNVSA